MKNGCKALVSVLIVLVLLATILPVGISASTAPRSLGNYNFTTGLTGAALANAAYTDSTGSHSDQSKLERRFGTDGGGYAVFYPNYDGKNPAHGFANVSFTPINLCDNPKTTAVESVDARYLILEMDFTTESAYSAALSLGFVPRYQATATGGDSPSATTNIATFVYKNGAPYLRTASKDTPLPVHRSVWSHLTVVLDIPQDNTPEAAKSTAAYIYLNGAFAGVNTSSITSNATYLGIMRINQSVGATVNSTETFCFDNVLVRALGADYSGNLGDILSDTTRSLTEFDAASYTDGYVFPTARALFDVDGVAYASLPELYSDLKGGETVTVLRDVEDIFTVTAPITVKNPGGYKFNYTYDGFTLVEGEDGITFLGDFDEVTVKWHIGDEIVEEVYTSPAPAVFKGSYEATKVVDGVTLCAVGFSRTDGGAVTDLGYVSEKNCEFWLVYRAPIATVTHSSGAVDYAYTDSDLEGFITSVADGDVILLQADATLSSYTVSGNKSFTLDLGGNTLTQAKDATNHLLILTGVSATVKNGSVDLHKNLIFLSEYSAGASVLIEDVRFTTSTAIADVRSGSTTFRRCTAGVSGDLITLFATSDRAAPTSVLVDECDFSAGYEIVSSHTKDAATKKYASVIVRNSSIAAGTLLGVEYCTDVRIEGGSLELTNLVCGGDVPSTVSIAEGTPVKCNTVVSGVVDNVTVNCDGGAAFARGESALVLTSEYGNVTWKVGAEYLTEAWVLGSMPVCPFDLPADTPTVKYAFPDVAVVTGDAEYVLTEMPAFTPMMNLSLSYDFDLGVYIPADAELLAISIGGVSYTNADASVVTVGGRAYRKYVYRGITPDSACEVVPLRLVLAGADSSLEADYELSLIGYLERILSGGYSVAAERLAVAVADYIDKAYIYSHSTSDPAYAEMSALRSLYDLGSSAVRPTGTPLDMSAVTSAVTSARLLLTSDFSLRLELSDGFSGTVRLNYLSGGVSTVAELTVVNGKYRGYGYIDLSLDAADMRSPVTVSISDGRGGYLSGSYDLYTYINAMSDTDRELSDLLGALYSYSVAAEAYRESK